MNTSLTSSNRSCGFGDSGLCAGYYGQSEGGGGHCGADRQAAGYRGEGFSGEVAGGFPCCGDRPAFLQLRHCSVQSDSGGQGSADSEYHRGHQEREYRVSE